MLGKEAIRKEIWKLMEESGISRFSKPIAGRIPNFEGSERAAQRLTRQREFQNANVVKVNPDSPQTHVRRNVLLSGKILIMPSPRLGRGFIVLDPAKIPAPAPTRERLSMAVFRTTVTALKASASINMAKTGLTTKGDPIGIPRIMASSGLKEAATNPNIGTREGFPVMETKMAMKDMANPPIIAPFWGK